jgi:hypothetical protein
VLIQCHFTAQGFSQTWTSPAGYVTLVKSAQFFNADTVAHQANLLIVSGSGQGSQDLVHEQCEPVTPLAWEGWIVLNPGDGVMAYAYGAPMFVWVMGAVLAGPNHFPPALGPAPTFALPQPAGTDIPRSPLP